MSGAPVKRSASASIPSGASTNNVATSLEGANVIQNATVFRYWLRCEGELTISGFLGCDTEEMAITRNASESLEICQYGIDLKPGDEILTTDQDYPRMINTWKQRERREGLVLKQISSRRRRLRWTTWSRSSTRRLRRARR